MSSKILLLLIGLAVISLGLPQKKVLVEAINCNRPFEFRSEEEARMYINCIKSNAISRYGKRSPAQGLFLRHMLPSPYADRRLQPSHDIQDFYDMLKYGDN